MTAPLTEFDQNQPIIKLSEVKSREAGHEETSKMFGKTAQLAFEKGSEMAENESKAMYLQSAGLMEDLKTSTYQKLLENPGQAKKIAEGAEYTAESIKHNSYVNSADRSKLNYVIDRQMDDVKLRATDVAVDQRRLGVASNFYTNLPVQLKSYQDFLVKGDEKASDSIHDALLATIRGAISIKAITPQQGANAIKAMQGVVESVHDLHIAYGNQDTTAQDYHTIASHPIGTMNVAGEGAQPIHGNTKWMVDYYTSDMSAQNVFSDINRGVLPNPHAFLSLTPDQRKKAIFMIQGTQKAQGMINGGFSYPALVKERDDLTQSGKVLNYQDQATRNALQIFIKDMQEGRFLDLMSRTPDGGQIMQKYMAQKSAINEFSDAVTQNKLQRNNDNALISNSVAWGLGRHMPSTFIKPFPETVISNVDNAFTAGNDPKPIFDAMGQYDKQNHAYLANSLKSPLNQVVFNTVSLAGGSVRPQDARTYVIANQKGQDFSALDLGKEGKHESAIRAKVAVGLRDQLDYILRQYSPEQAPVIYNSLIESGVNMAKMLALKNNDPTMSKSSFFSSHDYAKESVNFIKNAYPVKTGSNYTYNPNQMNLSDSDMQHLAQYALDHGYDRLKGIINEEQYITVRDRNKLTVTLTPTNELAAIGQDGNVYFSSPITSNLLSHALELKKKK